MKTHNEFMKDVEVESSLPAQTCRALGPESDKDVSMYLNDVVVSKGDRQ